MITYFDKSKTLPICKYRGKYDNIKYPCYVSLKLDGELAYIVKKQGKLFAVNKTPKYGRYRKDFPALEEFKDLSFPDGIYLAELYWNEGKTKEDFYGLLRNKTNNNLKLAIWGILQFYDETNLTAKEYFNYFGWYKEKIKQYKYLSIIPYEWIRNKEELNAWIEKYVNTGWEGLVVWNENAIWREGTTNKIIKIKKKKREIETKNKNGKAENLKLNKYGVWL